MPRRASRPLGSVRHLGGDRWEMRYRGASKTVRVQSATEARRALGRWISEHEATRAGGDTVAGICARWLAATKNRKTERTVEEQERLIRLHIAPSRVGAMNAGSVRAHHLEDFYDQLASTPRTTRRGPSTRERSMSQQSLKRSTNSQAKPVQTPQGHTASTTPSSLSSKMTAMMQPIDAKTGAGVGASPLGGGTIKHIHDVINAAFRWAQRRGIVDRNPAASASDRPSLNRRQVDIPDVQRLQKILVDLDSDDDKRFVMFVRLALVTGARRGELVGLQWDDLTGDGTLLLRRAVSEMQGGAVLIKGTKTVLSRRAVALDETTVRSLHVYRAWLERSCIASMWLFPDWRDPSRPDRPSRYSAKWRRTAGQARIRLHDLRHLVASLLLNAGIPVSEVSAQLGHAKTSTTHDIYGHLIGNRAAERAAIIADAINRPAIEPAKEE